MNDQAPPNNFAARLQRIEETRSTETPQDGAPTPRPASDVPAEESYLVRNTLIWIAFIAVFCTGGYFAAQALPQNLKDLVAGMVSPDGTSDSAPSSGLAETEDISN